MHKQLITLLGLVLSVVVPVPPAHGDAPNHPQTSANAPADATLLQQAPVEPQKLPDRRIAPARRAPESALQPAARGPRVSLFGGLPGLAVVVLLILALAMIAKRFAFGRRLCRSPAVQVLGRTYLSSKQSVALVRVGRRVTLVGITPDRISHLTTIDDPQEVDRLNADCGPAAARGFETALDHEAASHLAAKTQPRDAQPEFPTARATRQDLQQLMGRLRRITDSAPAD